MNQFSVGTFRSLFLVREQDTLYFSHVSKALKEPIIVQHLSDGAHGALSCEMIEFPVMPALHTTKG